MLKRLKKFFLTFLIYIVNLIIVYKIDNKMNFDNFDLWIL